MSAFDPSTGELRPDDLGLVIGPSLTLAAFEAHPDRPRFAAHVTNPPHRSFHARTQIDGAPFSVTLFFEGEALARVSFGTADPAIIGTSWAEFDLERVRRVQDEWLEARMGRGEAWHPERWPWGGVEHRRPWGTIGSFAHPQSADANLVLAYER